MSDNQMSSNRFIERLDQAREARKEQVSAAEERLQEVYQVLGTPVDGWRIGRLDSVREIKIVSYDLPEEGCYVAIPATWPSDVVVEMQAGGRACLNAESPSQPDWLGDTDTIAYGDTESQAWIALRETLARGYAVWSVED